MKVVYLNYFYDKDIKTPEELLKRYWSSTEWCKSVVKAGATKVSLVQRFHQDSIIEQDGVNSYFISDEYENKLLPFTNPQKVHEVIRTLQPDIVHHNGMPYPLLSLRNKLPKSTALVWQHHGGGMPQWYSRWFYKRGFSSIDGFFFTSEKLSKLWKKKELIDYFKPIYEIIESSSTLEPKDKFQCKEELGLQGNEIFLWVGRLDKNKDPLTVLDGFHRAMHSMQDPHLYMIYHEQPLLYETREFCIKNNINSRVHFIGKIDREKLAEYYSASDYFILGSHSEGSGYALLEALSCGLMPIVTDIPSFRKILSDGRIGYLWNPGEVNSLVNAITSATKERVSRNPLREYFDKHLSFEQLGKNALEAYENVQKIKNSIKKKIAVIVPGGIDKPDSGFNLAPLSNLINQLSLTNDIHVYSLVRLINDNEPFQCGNAKVKFLHARHNDSFLRKLWLLFTHVRQGMKMYQYDLLHGLWGMPTGFAAVVMGKIYKTKSIVSLMGAETANIPTIDYGNMQYAVQRSITLWTCRHADILIVLTEYQKQQLKYLGVLRTDIHKIPIGVDKNFFNCHVKNSMTTPLKLLAVGNLNKVKNQSVLLKSFKKIFTEINAELDIVGPDYLNGELQLLASELELYGNIRFHGMINHNKMKQFYENADILLHTSLHEAQGIVVAEAAATGVVICGTNVGLISDFYPDKSVAVEIGDADALATEVLKLIKDTKRLSSMRLNAYQWAKEHDLDWTVNRITAIYDTITNDNRH
jgi:glycosyltransferase involved in cell wall biosynthesis